MPSAPVSERTAGKMKRLLLSIVGFCLLLVLSACGDDAIQERQPSEEETRMPQLMIGDTRVAVDWEDNESVAALKDLCRADAPQIPMAMYGGFEQVGPLGTKLPRADQQITTAAGDIVLYAGDQLVLFYGANTWSYTRLGHVSDLSAAELASLLGQGDVTVTLWMEEEK